MRTDCVLRQYNGGLGTVVELCLDCLVPRPVLGKAEESPLAVDLPASTSSAGNIARVIIDRRQTARNCCLSAGWSETLHSVGSSSILFPLFV